MPPTLFVENVRDQPTIYHVSYEAVRQAMNEHGLAPGAVDIELGFSDDADSSSLARAEIYLGAAYDKRRFAGCSSQLRWFHSISAGVNRMMPFDWLPNTTIITNSAGAYDRKGAEFAISSLLMLNDQIPLHIANQREHRWSRAFSSSVATKTLLILGFGRLGQAAARYARIFEMEVIGVNRSGSGQSQDARIVPTAALKQLLPEADFLLVTAPLTDETRGLIDGESLASMKREAGIVNIGRGPIIDNQALKRELEAGRFRGVVLDVFEEEPLPGGSYVWDMPRTIVVPHVGVDDSLSIVSDCLRIFADNLERYLLGASLKNVVDRKLGY